MAQTTYRVSVNMGDSNPNSGNITGSFNQTVFNNKTVDRSDEDAQIMRWLSPLEPSTRHQGVRNERFDGVGDWLLETTGFQEWRGGEGGVDKAVLFCSGNPGVGKTYLSSLVIDSLCDQAGKEIVVAGMYYDFSAQREQTVTNMMGAVLKQLVGSGDIPSDLRDAFRKAKKEFGGRGLRLPDLIEMLGIAITLLPQVFICIDALDECLPKDLPKLLESLRDIIQESPTTRIFLTGRPHVSEDIERYFSKVVVIPIIPTTDDIKSYLEMRLSEDTDPEMMNDGLRADIIKAILGKISDIFLLVSLNIDAILGEVTIRQRRKKLEEMTKGHGLGGAYTATLTRLKAQKGKKPILGLKVLMWVLYSQRPLRAKELCHAIGVEMGSTDPDVENVPALRTLLASCLGLVTVEAPSSTIRLVHHTLQEHLLSDPTLFHSPHSKIAEVCLTYLNFECIRGLSSTLLSAPATMPLLEYASYFWGEHTRRGMTENVKVLALRLLDRFDEHISAQLMLLHYNGDGRARAYFGATKGPTGFTGLHGAAFLGIVEIVATILKMKKWDVSATDRLGSTALIWAAGRGHEEVVKILLEQEDVNPNQADTNYGWTPLLWASRNGHWGVLKMLLERRDVNPDQTVTNYVQTPLMLAVENGEEGIVKKLLERGDVDPNQAVTKFGWTPLLWAAENGHEGIVKILLQRRDVNPNQTDTQYGRTPLLRAAKRGHNGVVKILLERGDVNLDQPDILYGRAPFSWAAENGHEGVVKMFLERENINPDQAGTGYGWTPLLRAAKYGHEGVVKLLLGRGDVDPNRADTDYGQTPLSWAAENGHEGVIKMLLERSDVNPDQPDTEYGWTPLSWASGNGHEGVVKMLLERGDVDPNRADTDHGQTPLSWAAGSGHEGVVRILLKRGDVNPDQADTEYGRTPLSWAAENGHSGVVKILLEREDVNPDQPDTRYDRTPLSWATECGRGDIVKMFLEWKHAHRHAR